MCFSERNGIPFSDCRVRIEMASCGRHSCVLLGGFLYLPSPCLYLTAAVPPTHGRSAVLRAGRPVCLCLCPFHYGPPQSWSLSLEDIGQRPFVFSWEVWETRR